MPLSLADKGVAYTIVKILGQDKVRNHLQNLGLVENAQVYVLDGIDGNLIVEVKNTRIAIDKHLANRIMV